MVSVGHRTGLFDVMSTSSPATSEEIAARAGLNERYVREWLGAMVTSRVVDVEPTTLRFSLPAEHAASLTRTAGADNMAVFAQYVAIMGGVEDEIVECFQKGGGVPYSRFTLFHDVMAEDSGQSVLSSLESHILPLVPGLTDRLAKGIRVLDAGCGRGRILSRLAALYPRSRFLGVDLSSDAITYAREEASRAGLDNVEFVAADLTDFDRTAEQEAFAFITTFDAVHDPGEAAQPPQRHSSGVEARRCLRDAGHQRDEPRRQGHRAPDWNVPVCHLLHALHDSLACARRRRSRRDVGRGEDARVSPTSGLSMHYHAPAGTRHSEQLVRRYEVVRSSVQKRRKTQRTGVSAMGRGSPAVSEESDCDRTVIRQAQNLDEH
jgi:SAM-dependent methyltransferase